MWKYGLLGIATLLFTAAMALLMMLGVHVGFATPMERGMAEWQEQTSRMMATLWYVAIAAFVCGFSSLLLSLRNSSRNKKVG